MTSDWKLYGSDREYNFTRLRTVVELLAIQDFKVSGVIFPLENVFFWLLPLLWCSPEMLRVLDA